MIDKKDQLPPCFGHLDTVFPKGNDGFRNTPETCLACTYKTECLRTAMKGAEGLKIREEYIDRAYASGIMSFLERWSLKKDLKRRLKDK